MRDMWRRTSASEQDVIGQYSSVNNKILQKPFSTHQRAGKAMKTKAVSLPEGEQL